ncbi:DUF6567 family protein [Candidatus Uabimicrobium amorphum]|uniref:Lipoprotein n=1 Tax=Uabimicrobium amorphum TaxID=2596890 RepID=A0A5S9IIU8_UABAM|nr:DUF6567 family protein [Candidatus Uabimicrobium amorphum]BBM81860.1 hypothetical protein UABAM_00202 [Candidatus Uabimicrobium amorphum]
MKKVVFLVAIVAIAFTGCVAAGGMSNGGFSSNTNLKSSGYSVVKTVSAKASTMYILGSILFDAPQADLHKRAFQDLRSQAGLQGKSQALANITTDVVERNYLVVRFVELTVTADVVSFE